MRTLIIGLDGADFNVMAPWIRKGRLPNLRHLIQTGVSCPLKSTWPPNTSPAWPALVTGMSPGNLGLFDFTRPDGYGKRIVSRQEIPYPALWDVLTKHGRGVVVVGVPMTYPPPKVRGAMVAGFLSPPGRNNGQPMSLLGRFPQLSATSRFLNSEHDLVRRTLDICSGTLKLLAAFKWDVAMVVFNATDWAMHFHWSKPGKVRRVFENVDVQVGRLVHNTKADNVVIVSDHGFRPVTRLVDVNQILEETGFLVDGNDVSRTYPRPRDLKNERDDAPSTPYKPSRFAPSWLRFRKWLLKQVSRRIEDVGRFSALFSPRFVENKGAKLAALSRFNWEKTTAYLYSPGSMTINLNVREREPKGIVSKEDFERVRREVMSALSEWKDPADGKRIFRKVFAPQERYSGRRVNMAPDIFFELEPGFHALSPGFGRATWRVRGVGQHAPYGVFIGRGSMFRKTDVGEMNIVDVLPTLLKGMSVPVPGDLDGRVVEEILSRGGESG